MSKMSGNLLRHVSECSRNVGGFLSCNEFGFNEHKLGLIFQSPTLPN
jgi:hypothetical protein